jgi:hypothetical protein
MDRPSSRLAPFFIAAALLLPAVLLAVYAAGYFWLSVPVADYMAEQPNKTLVSDRPFPGSTLQLTRWYQHRWQATIFKPAAVVESRLRGRGESVSALPFPQEWDGFERASTR